MADSKNRPTHYFYISKKNAKEGETDGEFKRENLIKVGGAWAHKDGKGLSIPFGNARLIVREAKEFPYEEEEQPKKAPVAAQLPTGKVKLPD